MFWIFAKKNAGAPADLSSQNINIIYSCIFFLILVMAQDAPEKWPPQETMVSAE